MTYDSETSRNVDVVQLFLNAHPVLFTPVAPSHMWVFNFKIQPDLKFSSSVTPATFPLATVQDSADYRYYRPCRMFYWTILDKVVSTPPPVLVGQPPAHKWVVVINTCWN